MKDLNNLIEEIEQAIPFYIQQEDSISSVSVAWQLHHTLSVIVRISKVLIKTNPKDYKKDFNMRRNVIFTLGKIPRGRGKAPDAVNKLESIEKEEIIDLLKQAKALITMHESLPEHAFFTHHYFGTMNKKQTLKFINIHTEHHLKIVREIRNT